MNLRILQGILVERNSQKSIFVFLINFRCKSKVIICVKVVRAYCSAQQNSRMLCNIASTAADKPLFYNNSQLY